jgi:hypothetical protein
MKIALIIFALIFVALVCIAWIGYSFGNVPAPQVSQNQSTTESCKSCFSAFNIALSDGWNQIGIFIRNFHEEIVAVGTLFIALFTIILAFATGFLYVATRDLVKGAEKTAEQQLRAYLYIFPVSMIIFQPNEKMLVSLSTRNHGQTPLRNAYIKFGFAIAANNAENDYTVPDEMKVTARSPISLAANSEPYPLQLGSKQSVSDTDFKNVQAGTHVIIVEGVLTYEDIFKIERHTWFNYAFSWDQMVAVANMVVKNGFVGGAGPATYSKNGNDFD